MRQKLLAAGILVMLTALLAGCTTGARTGEGRSPFTTGGSSDGLGFGLDLLSGGDERARPSGRTVTEDFDIRGFDGLEISHAFEVEVVRSSSYEVEVRIDGNLREYLRVEKRGDILAIGLEPLRSFNTGNAVLEAEVHMPDLRRVKVSGAGDVRISGFSSAGGFEVDLSGASYLGGEITAREVRAEASGASRIRLRGKAEDLRLKVSGASNADLEKFPVDHADIELSGASEAAVALSGTLDIDASGASRLFFGGNPTMGRVELSGASSIKRL
jgi:hypothetical protein